MEERKKILEETKCKRNESFGIEKNQNWTK